MLAERQRGAIDRAGLRACGLSDSAITRQIACGRLHPKWPGVYAVGHSRLTREGWWWAALLAGGPGAILALVPQVNAWFPTIAASASGRPTSCASWDSCSLSEHESRFIPSGA